MTSADITFAKNPDIIGREVAGEYLLIPIRRHLKESNSIYVLNETGASFWRRIDGKQNFGNILSQLAEEYEVSVEQLQNDLASLIEDLITIKAIEEITP